VNKVVLAVGVEPNTALAEPSGLEIAPECGGFLVNAELEVRSNLYAVSEVPKKPTEVTSGITTFVPHCTTSYCIMFAGGRLRLFL